MHIISYEFASKCIKGFSVSKCVISLSNHVLKNLQLFLLCSCFLFLYMWGCITHVRNKLFINMRVNSSTPSSLQIEGSSPKLGLITRGLHILVLL